MSVLNENQLMGASGAGTSDYEIEQSLRFNDGDNAYLSRTPSSAGNRKTWTWSGWVKRGNIPASNQTLFTTRVVSTPSCQIQLLSTYNLRFQDTGISADLRTSALLRDSASWYHIQVAVDTTQSTSSDRVKIYINGEQVTDFSTETYPSLNGDTVINSASQMEIGTQAYSPSPFDGYLAEVNFIDGLALTPDNFGETGDYGEWKPIAYAGTYGTNGFYLKFENASSLGNDSAGSNNWTPSNLAATDQMVDSPTNNFATLNSLTTDLAAQSEGNLQKIGTDNTANIGTFGVSAGKWYYEVYINTGSITPYFGITPESNDSDRGGSWAESGRGFAGGSDGYYKTYNGSSIVSKSTLSLATGDVFGVAFDCDAGTIKYYVNNSLKHTDTTMPTGVEVFPLFLNTTSGNNTWKISNANFGADSSFAGNKTAQGNQDANSVGDFFYPVPSGFLSLCTKSLPSVDVIPREHFNTVLYTGTGSTQSITGVGFGSAPDFVWIKNRDGTNGNQLLDIVRGATKHLSSNTTGDESTATTGLTSFDSDGFSLGSATGVNTNDDGFVAWNWKAGGSASSNTNGSITSQVSANPAAGFSIVSWTGTGAVLTAGHGLSQKPELIITKDRDGTFQWIVYNADIGATGRLILSATNGDDITSAIFFNNTEPTSTVFTNGTYNNTNGGRNISYCFHSVDGYSKVGSYTGNGSAGTFVHCGFRPAYVMVKRTDSANNWDISTGGDYFSNQIDARLRANTSGAEDTTGYIDFVSNGFKMRNYNGSQNANGGTYIFLAFAESPFKHTNAR